MSKHHQRRTGGFGNETDVTEGVPAREERAGQSTAGGGGVGVCCELSALSCPCPQLRGGIGRINILVPSSAHLSDGIRRTNPSQWKPLILCPNQQGWNFSRETGGTEGNPGYTGFEGNSGLLPASLPGSSLLTIQLQGLASMSVREGCGGAVLGTERAQLLTGIQMTAKAHVCSSPMVPQEDDRFELHKSFMTSWSYSAGTGGDQSTL